jgi:hypothetical protein
MESNLNTPLGKKVRIRGLLVIFSFFFAFLGVGILVNWGIAFLLLAGGVYAVSTLFKVSPEEKAKFKEEYEKAQQ